MTTYRVYGVGRPAIGWCSTFRPLLPASSERDAPVKGVTPRLQEPGRVGGQAAYPDSSHATADSLPSRYE